MLNRKTKVKNSDNLNRRLALGETQAKLNSDADAKLEGQLLQRVKERNDKAAKEMAEQKLKKKKREEEMKTFYQNYASFYILPLNSNRKLEYSSLLASTTCRKRRI